eukprot:Gregarina_sp_Poly_1__10864@NODE_844_length_6011_cov_277_085128_g601_i1_p1_GENE_NODE_844_length_6011_cov_277_085128_g601_i1NODE_844_length_6011_cov_277_085128_g601_i1_p1_ORF_typecomplete_len496_score59_96_NODE_844_length_6011_cov_277_085128_g601_i138145301
MERSTTLRRAHSTPSQLEAKRLCMSTPSADAFSPTIPFRSANDAWASLDPATIDTDSSHSGDMTHCLEGLRLGSSLSFSSPRSIGRDAKSEIPPKSTPFVYCETDTFGGDQTTKASAPTTLAHTSISGFPASSTPLDQPVKAATKLPGVKNRLELVLAEREIERLSRELMGDLTTPSESNWSAAKVRFDDDVKVFEYDKPVYDEILEDSLLGFQPNNVGLEPWSAALHCGSNSDISEFGDDCICAPPHMAFIPLIPNRRLVGGGGEEIEKRQYNRCKKRAMCTEPMSAPSCIDDSGGVSGGTSSCPNLNERSEYYDAAANRAARNGSETAAQMRRTISEMDDETSTSNCDATKRVGLSSVQNSNNTLPYFFPPPLLSPIAQVTVQSPTGVDKLLAESLRPTEDSQEPQTPSARSRKGSMSSCRASMDESASGGGGGDRTNRAGSSNLGFKSCRSLSPLSRFQTLVTDSIDLKTKDNSSEEQDNNKRMNSTQAVVV